MPNRLPPLDIDPFDTLASTIRAEITHIKDLKARLIAITQADIDAVVREIADAQNAQASSLPTIPCNKCLLPTSVPVPTYCEHAILCCWLS